MLKCKFKYYDPYPYFRRRSIMSNPDQHYHQIRCIQCKACKNASIFISPNSILFSTSLSGVQYIPRNMHTVFALLCFVVVIHWLIFPYPSGLLHWHCGNLTIAPVPAKQPWWIWINTSCEFIMNDCITTTKQSTNKPCAYFLGYTVNWKDSLTRLSWISRILCIFQDADMNRLNMWQGTLT